MGKQLKTYVDEHRRAFDDELPSPNTWDKIEQRMLDKKKGRVVEIRKIFKWAAAAVIVIALGTGLYFFVIHNRRVEPDQTATAGHPRQGALTEFGSVSPDYAAKAQQIFESIEKQQSQLKALANEHPNLYNQFARDIATLDSSYRVLKNEAVLTPNREVIIKAMIQNLQLQAELLSKQLMIINEYNNNKTERNEKDAYRPV